MTFFDWLDYHLTNRKINGLVHWPYVVQFILDYNKMHGQEFDKKYKDMPTPPECECSEPGCWCLEFTIMEHMLEPVT